VYWLGWQQPIIIAQKCGDEHRLFYFDLNVNVFSPIKKPRSFEARFFEFAS